MAKKGIAKGTVKKNNPDWKPVIKNGRRTYRLKNKNNVRLSKNNLVSNGNSVSDSTKNLDSLNDAVSNDNLFSSKDGLYWGDWETSFETISVQEVKQNDSGESNYGDLMEMKVEKETISLENGLTISRKAEPEENQNDGYYYLKRWDCKIEDFDSHVWAKNVVLKAGYDVGESAELVGKLADIGEQNFVEWVEETAISFTDSDVWNAKTGFSIYGESDFLSESELKNILD